MPPWRLPLRTALARGDELAPVQRRFLNLPLEQGEDRADPEKTVEPMRSREVFDATRGLSRPGFELLGLLLDRGRLDLLLVARARLAVAALE